MILRKPYAFLIKKFRLIHLILSILIGDLLYHTISILKVYNNYISSNQINDIANIIDNLFRPIMYIIFLLFIAVTLVITIVLKLKKKPITMYICSLLISLVTIIVYFYSLTILKTIAISSVDVRTVRAIRDILFLLTVLQSIQLLLMTVRTTGFDIKKFDFGKDLIGLEINESDNEEVEVNFDLNSQQSKRKLKYNLRNIKYVYVENKFLFNILFVIIIFIIFSIFIIKLVFKSKVYNQGEYFYTDSFSASINKSYVTSRDYKGNVLSNDYSFVILDTSIKAFFNKYFLNYGRLFLTIDGVNYYPTIKYNDSFIDIGTPYSQLTINNENYDNYLIIFVIPDSAKEKEIKLVYQNQYSEGSLEDSQIVTRLTPKNLDKENTTKTYNLDDSIKIDNNLFDNGYIEINEVTFGEQFDFEYDFCPKQCYTSYFTLTPTIYANKETVIMKIIGIGFSDSDVNFNKFVSMYGSLLYDDNKSTYFKDLSSVVKDKALGDELYFEVDKDVLNSKEIYLQFLIRGNTYKFKIK